MLPAMSDRAATAVHWHARPFRELGLDELYALLRLRAEVFVVEQQCAYLDPDGKDVHPDAIHLLGIAGDGTLAAYLRILPPGLSYPQVSMGRVLTAPTHRGCGTCTSASSRRTASAWG